MATCTSNPIFSSTLSTYTLELLSPVFWHLTRSWGSPNTMLKLLRANKMLQTQYSAAGSFGQRSLSETPASMALSFSWVTPPRASSLQGLSLHPPYKPMLGVAKRDWRLDSLILCHYFISSKILDTWSAVHNVMTHGSRSTRKKDMIGRVINYWQLIGTVTLYTVLFFCVD